MHFSALEEKLFCWHYNRAMWVIPSLSLTHSPVSETLPVPELRLLLFSISFHARALRFRTTSTCLRPWWSFDDSNLPGFSMLSLRRVISVRRFSSQLCHGPRTTTPRAPCGVFVRAARPRAVRGAGHPTKIVYEGDDSPRSENETGLLSHPGRSSNKHTSGNKMLCN